jgi:uncharacterized membrane protein
MSPNTRKSKNFRARNINKDLNEQLTFGERVADKVASFGGSWPFIFLFALVLSAWMLYQSFIAHNRSFDPYPYILLNLILSCLAAIQAPVIMMSQNRHAQRDRLQADHDYEINLRAEMEIEDILSKLEHIKINQETGEILARLESIELLLKNQLDTQFTQTADSKSQ